MTYTEDQAWAAGFWDGEGSAGAYFYTQKGVRTRHIRANIKQIDAAVLRRFRDIVGAGSVTGPHRYKNKTANAKPQWTFQAQTREEVEQIFVLLRPWLSLIKINQFEKALEKYDSFPLKRKRAA